MQFITSSHDFTPPLSADLAALDAGRQNARVMALLTALDALPDETLSAEPRAALAAAITSGAVTALYRAHGSPDWQVCIADLAPDLDKRLPLVQWVALWQRGQDAAEALVRAYTDLQLRIWWRIRQSLTEGGAR